MELVTFAKKDEDKENFTKEYNYITFSVSKLQQLCFARGINTIR